MNDIETTRALLREHLRFFIRRVFSSIAPGAEYLENWHVDAIAHHLELC